MNNEKIAADIAEWMKDHEYTELASNSGQAQVWRCQKPDTIHLAFDIVITRFGIAMFGDVGTLVFKVGASYGLPFLARKPDDYMLEKLETQFRAEREFDQDALYDHVAHAIFEKLEESDVPLPEWMTDQATRGGKFDDLYNWMSEMEDAEKAPFEEAGVDIDELSQAMFAAINVEDPDSAHEMLAEHEEMLGIGDTWEYRLTKPSTSVVRRLHYISHAARAILAQQEAEAGQQVAP